MGICIVQYLMKPGLGSNKN